MVAVYSRKAPVSLDLSDGYQSTSASLEDEGEMMSGESSESWSGGSSEEGEIQSEIEENDVSPEAASIKEETPWERGLRLARERVEKAKVIRATEKDLAEKRMTLPVVEPVAITVVENDETFIEDIFWPCYYQPSIVGHTELTGRRYLPEDLLDPTKEQTQTWRRSLRTSGRRRTSQYSPLSSRSGSVSSQTSSQYSRHRSSSAASIGSASSMVSIAGSWKASCARALRNYLGSPTHGGDGGGGKARRSARYGGGTHGREGKGRSSSSGNSSSSRRSGSSHSGSRRRYIYAGGIARVIPSGIHGRTDISPSSRSSSGSTRGGRRDGQLWKANCSGIRMDKDRRRQGFEHGSESPESRPLPLPHERPVKRPWVADPSLASIGNMGGHTHRPASRDGSSRSRSGSPLAGDEKQYITSWSRSPSSGNERRPAWHRRERLPDVVPGVYAERVRRAVTPSRRRTSRSPFAGDQVNGSHISTGMPASELDSCPISRPGVSGKTTTVTTASLDVRGQTSSGAGHSSAAQLVGDTGAQSTVSGKSGPPTGGALPSASSRPGVRMTLAPRLKSSGLGAATLTGAASRAATANRQVFAMSPPPATRQLPPPSAASPASYETPKPLSPTQIRMQAEAVAAIVEAREKRRAAAEAARRQRNPNRQRRKNVDHLSSIPLRGRPTYRRMSFSSDSSYTSRSSASSTGTSRSGSRQNAAVQQNVKPKMGRQTSKAGPDDQQQQQQSVGQFEKPRHSGKYPNVGGMGQQQHLQRKRHHRTYQMGGEEFGAQAELDDGLLAYEHQPPGGDVYGRGGAARLDRMGLPAGPGPTQPQRARRQRNRPQFDRFGNTVYETGGLQYKSVPPPEAFRSWSEMGYFDADDMEPPSHHGDYRMKGPRQADNNAARYPGGAGRFDGRRSAAAGVMYPSSRAYHDGEPLPHGRSARPGTPHAVGNDNYPFVAGNRSPHGNFSMPTSTAQRHHARSRPGPEQDSGLGGAGLSLPAGSRKRNHPGVAHFAATEDYDEGGEAKRARSRHRSRGPGAPIDRSEPFESDAGNSFAAEQRLRQLRERLNFVDDAIAEIKASGATVGGYSGSRK